jgi:hypothetical protein
MSGHIAGVELIGDGYANEPDSPWQKGDAVTYCLKCGLRIFPGEDTFETAECDGDESLP